MIVATPMPPPMQSVISARLALRRSSSSTMVPVIMAPVAAPCLIDGEKKACVILLADDYAKLEAALCDGRSGCKLGP